jgi:hypothetical protein
MLVFCEIIYVQSEYQISASGGLFFFLTIFFRNELGSLQKKASEEKYISQKKHIKLQLLRNKKMRMFNLLNILIIFVDIFNLTVI